MLAHHGQVYGHQDGRADMGWLGVDYGDGLGWCGIWSHSSCPRTSLVIFSNPSHVTHTISYPLSHDCD